MCIEASLIKNMLCDLRHLRDLEKNTEMRSHYNAAADRLDVLVSKLNERDNAERSPS